MQSELLAKYDVPAPRYTSYPTVPHWQTTPTQSQWLSSLQKSLLSDQSSWSLYMHIPFCESLCTYCGCTHIVTKNHRKEDPYVDLLLREWNLYKKNVPDLLKRRLKTLHLGGGTPTFLSADSLRALLEPILSEVPLHEKYFEGAIEVDPRRTNNEQLLTLHELGFRRLSLGVQDFNEEVQRLINRVQPFSITKALTDSARDIGYESINFDLIYGLPKQCLTSMKNTIEKTLELRPDRIALYSLAIVPWIKPAQRLFKLEDLPGPSEKRKLYETARESFLKAGYIEIGMDHFALPKDDLALAREEGRLHRNFMGYTTDRSNALIGLGASAISESSDCFHQNFKDLKTYENSLEIGRLPTAKGHILDEKDILLRKQITDFMVRSKTEVLNQEQMTLVKDRLSEMFKDQLVEVDGSVLKLTEKGRPFLRNACMALDAYLWEGQPKTKVFSSAI